MTFFYDATASLAPLPINQNYTGQYQNMMANVNNAVAPMTSQTALYGTGGFGADTSYYSALGAAYLGAVPMSGSGGYSPYGGSVFDTGAAPVPTYDYSSLYGSNFGSGAYSPYSSVFDTGTSAFNPYAYDPYGGGSSYSPPYSPSFNDRYNSLSAYQPPAPTFDYNALAQQYSPFSYGTSPYAAYGGSPFDAAGTTAYSPFNSGTSGINYTGYDPFGGAVTQGFDTRYGGIFSPPQYDPLPTDRYGFSFGAPAPTPTAEQFLGMNPSDYFSYLTGPYSNPTFAGRYENLTSPLDFSNPLQPRSNLDAFNSYGYDPFGVGNYLDPNRFSSESQGLYGGAAPNLSQLYQQMQYNPFQSMSSFAQTSPFDAAGTRPSPYNPYAQDIWGMSMADNTLAGFSQYNPYADYQPVAQLYGGGGYTNPFSPAAYQEGPDFSYATDGSIYAPGVSPHYPDFGAAAQSLYDYGSRNAPQPIPTSVPQPPSGDTLTARDRLMPSGVSYPSPYFTPP